MTAIPATARSIALASLALSIGRVLAAETLVTFDDLPLPGPNTYWNGSDNSGAFTDSGVTFHNTYNPDWGTWGGFAYSNVNDPATGGYGNQYAVISGTDHGGLGHYAVAYDQGTDDRISLPAAGRVNGFYLNNTTYAALSMLQGDAFAKKFGGPSGSDPDWFRLTITGLNAAEQPTGTLDFYLADYRPADANDDYVLTDWTWVDLSPLGHSVAHLDFSLASSDVGAFGMNTPGYFALDSLSITVVPEPSTWALALTGLILLSVRRGRRQSNRRAPR